MRAIATEYPGHLFFACILIAITSALGESAAQDGKKVDCRPAGALVRIAELHEASGIAASHKGDRRAWAHNDSGDPVVVALDERGRVTGRIPVPDAKVEDWEAMAAGPCPSGSCLYIADIGDNDANRERITIYRTSEPAGAAPARAEALHARYPDGKHDAETILVTPKGEIFIVTKGETGPVALYRFPPDGKLGTTVELVRVGEPQVSKGGDAKDRITDGAVSPDGAWVVLRTKVDLRFFPAAAFLSGKWVEAGRIDVSALGEPQGEGVTFADDRTLLLAGEGGGKSRPGTFARLACTF